MQEQAGVPETTMRAAILAPAGFAIHRLAKPPCGDDELLVETVACGVCSGDLFLYQHRHELAAAQSRLGHEASGLVVAVGRDVTGFAAGDMVTSLSSPAFADYFVASLDQVVKLAPEIDPVTALGEPLACCVHAAGRFGLVPGDRVAVVGCGFMGLICLQLARHQGAGLVSAFDPLTYRRDMAQRLGADVMFDPTVTRAKDVVEKHGVFDIIIEAAGTQSALDLCTDLVKEHGRVILVGYHQSQGGLRTVNMQQWNYKAIDVVNGHVRRGDEKLEAMRQAVELLRQGRLVTAPLVTTYDLDQVEQAFRDLSAGKQGLFKAVLLGHRSVPRLRR
jgi:threonine dehydrogenase-like Zn-dependent dehydrogenase